MTHFSLKNAILLASYLSFTTGISVFAAPSKVLCTTDPLFAANACEVCYTEKSTVTKGASGWTAELSTVKIPWEHGGTGELGEVILESEQTPPDIIPSTGVTVTPLEPILIWEFDTDIVWYSVSSDNEFYIDKGVTKNLYTLKTGVKLSVAGTGDKGTVLFKTHLPYEDYDVNMAEVSTGKSRNICVLENFGTTQTAGVQPPVVPPVARPVVPPVVVPPVDTQDPPLNSAGPDEVEITPEQTETEAGPGMWIFLLLFAFVFSSAWTAWKKQKS